jgi:hypothetical protein
MMIARNVSLRAVHIAILQRRIQNSSTEESDASATPSSTPGKTTMGEKGRASVRRNIVYVRGFNVSSLMIITASGSRQGS